MPTDIKLESYLAALDKALANIPVSDRADIITEIKSHVLSAQEKDPSQTVASILSSLGEPETVANRYLIERGLKPGKASKSPMIKWLTIGFLGTFGIASLTLILLIWQFSPLISVDEENDRVILLGGVIDVNGKEGTAKLGSMRVENKGSTFNGTKELDPKDYKEIKLAFNNGKFEIQPSLDNQIRWRCKVDGNSDLADINVDKKTFELNLEKFKGSKCELELPKGIKTIVTGANGKLSIERPQFAMDISLANGKIDISPDPAKKYNYDMKVTNGMVKGFESSTAADAIPIKVSVTNGYVKSDID